MTLALWSGTRLRYGLEFLMPPPGVAAPLYLAHSAVCQRFRKTMFLGIGSPNRCQSALCPACRKSERAALVRGCVKKFAFLNAVGGSFVSKSRFAAIRDARRFGKQPTSLQISFRLTYAATFGKARYDRMVRAV